MKQLILVFFLVPFLGLHAQGKAVNLDSIQQILPTLEGRDKIKALIRLTHDYEPIDPERSIEFGKAVLALASQAEDYYFVAIAYDLMGRAYHRLNNYIFASDCFEKGLEAVKKLKNRPGLAVILYNSYALMMVNRGEYDKALPHYLEAKSISKQLGNHQHFVQCLINLGRLYAHLKEHDKAIETLKQAISLEDELGEKTKAILGQANNNLGTVYEELGIYSEALKCYHRALDIHQPDSRKSSHIASLTSLFSVYSKLDQEVKANMYFQKAFQLAKEEENNSRLQRLYFISADHHFEKGRLAQALKQYKKSLEFAESIDSKDEMMKLNSKIAGIYQQQNKYREAYRHKEAYQALKDKLFNQTKAREIAEIQAKYDLKQMEEEISDLKREEEFTEFRTYGLLAIISLFLIVLAALYSRYRIRQRSLFILEQQHQQIEEKNRQLEEQSHDIQAKNRKLGEINQELGQFAYAASHDLKQPLRTISSYLDLLRKRYGEKLDDDANLFIQYANSGAKRMDKILKDLLSYSQVGRSQIHKEAVNLNQVLEQIQYQLALQIAETSTRIQYESLPVVQARPTEMVQLFQNLISNGIKFRAPGRKPHIFIGYEKTPKEHIISVADNGIGISVDFEQKVFEMFERQHSQDQFEGNGIGLALCKKIMDYHEGRIWFKTIPGEGTTFFLAFPTSVSSLHA